MVAKKKEPKISQIYEIDDGKLNRKKRECPRCGRGVFMAQHSDRSTCGKCSFTEFIHKDKKK
ncbi:MAG: 30S ribosomal protein S27ae [Nitrososphaeraceae archaeon]